MVEFLSGIRQKAAVERTILTEGDIRRVLSRITHQILERHKSVQGLVLAGILTRGLPLARRLAGKIRDLEGVDVPVTGLDIRPYRDDGALSVEALPLQPVSPWK